jgi:hypothetical protein
MKTTTGHCLCRAIAFAYEGEPKWILNCHCEDCRRAASAPMTTWVSVLLKDFRFTAGQLSYENDEMPDEIHLLAGALADPGAVRPAAHIFTVDQLAWFDAADELPRYLHTRRDAQPTHVGPRNSRTKG